MRIGRSCSGAVVLAIATLLVSGTAASVQRGARRQAIYVVAVKDSDVLTMCPALHEATMANGRTWKSDGRAVVSRQTDDLQLLRFPRRQTPAGEGRGSRALLADPRFRTELSGTQVVLPISRTALEEASLSATSGGTELGRDLMSMDSALKQAVERELAKLDVSQVVDSVDAADLVILIEGSYVSLAASSTADTGRSGQPPPQLVAAAQPGDWQRNLLQSVLAIAVPAAVYRGSPGDVPGLFSARIWEGSEVAQTPYQIKEESRTTGVTRWETGWSWQSASPEALVWQFAGMKPRPASHPPLCAVSSQTFQVPAAASSQAGVTVVSGDAATVAGSRSRGSEATATFKGGVTYVSVPVSVTDREGRAVVGLNPSRFRVYEDETPQVIDRVALPGE